MKIIVKSPHSWPKIVIHSNSCIILNINCNIWPTPMGGFNSLRLTDTCMHQLLLTIIDSDNGLWPGQHQAIIWTNAGILLIGLEKKLPWNLNKILTFLFKKILKYRLQNGLSLNVLSCSVKTTSSSHSRQSDDTHSLDEWPLDPCTSWYWTESDSTGWSLVLDLISPISYGLNINSTAIEW